jgi:NTP pyrophosphatase (non-canonical NTP hydrolase)
MQQSKYSFDEVREAVMKHVTERGWHKDNVPRGVAISLSLEANELLEHYQWHDEPVGSIDELGEELADVLIYAVQFANWYDIDMSEAIMKKLEKSAKKYPVEKFQTNDPEERKKNWLEIKKNYKKDTTL